MPDLKTYDLFISHAWSYNDEYYKLVEMLAGASNFKWRNYSVPEHDPVDASNTTKLKEALRRQIRPANAVIILSGMYVAYSGWIQFEIDFAVELGKPIIGVIPWGGQVTPTAVSRVAKEMVRWQTDSIVAAIRKHSL